MTSKVPPMMGIPRDEVLPDAPWPQSHFEQCPNGCPGCEVDFVSTEERRCLECGNSWSTCVGEDEDVSVDPPTLNQRFIGLRKAPTVLMGACYAEEVGRRIEDEQRYDVSYIGLGEEALVKEGINFKHISFRPSLIVLMVQWAAAAGFVKEDHWDWRMSRWQGVLQQALLVSDRVAIYMPSMTPRRYFEENEGMGMNNSTLSSWEAGRSRFLLEMSDLFSMCWRVQDDQFAKHMRNHAEYAKEDFTQPPWHYTPFYYDKMKERVCQWIQEDWDER